MPKYEVKSAKTGKTYKFEAESQPSETDIDEYVAHQDSQQQSSKAPSLGARKETVNELLMREYGGVIDSPELNEQDRQAALSDAKSRGAQAQKEVNKAEEISRTNPLESAVMGAAQVPAGLASLGGIGLIKALEASGTAEGKALADKYRKELQDTGEYIQKRAEVNPVSAFAGQTGANLATTGTGGTIQNLAKGEFAQAGKQLAVNAPLNVAIGSGIRSLVGADTDTRDIEQDLLLSLLGGRGAKGERPKIMAEGETGALVPETNVQDMIDEVMRRKKLDAEIKNRIGQQSEASQPTIVQTPTGPMLQQAEGLPVTTQAQVAAKEAGKQVEGGFSPISKPKNFVELSTEATKESLDDLFGGDSGKLAMSAIKPSVHAGGNVRENLSNIWIPRVYESAKKNGIKLDSWDNIEDASRHAVNDTWNKIDYALDQAGKSGAVVPIEKFNNQVQRRILSNKAFELESMALPERQSQMKQIDGLLESYQGKSLTPQQAEEVLQTQNELLESFYNKAQLRSEGMTVEKLAKKDPVMATRLLLAEQLRSELDNVASTLPNEFSNLKREYGTLSSIVPMIAKRKIMEERQQQLSLQQKMTMGQAFVDKGVLGAGRLGAAKIFGAAMKKADSGEQKLTKAFYQYHQSLNK